MEYHNFGSFGKSVLIGWIQNDISFITFYLRCKRTTDYDTEISVQQVPADYCNRTISPLLTSFDWIKVGIPDLPLLHRSSCFR